MQATPLLRKPARTQDWARKAFLALGVLLLATAVTTYVANPFRTATKDVRGRVLGYMTYRIPSSAMAPTLRPGDFIFVTTHTYRKQGPRVGDVVVFEHADTPGEPTSAWVSRVAARGGDRIEIRDAVVFVNDEPLDEPYVLEARHPRSRTMDATAVPPGFLFLLGDNRDNSNDSRFYGFVPESAVIGRVRRIWYSEDSSRTGEIR
jgi:signal peptidase I